MSSPLLLARHAMAARFEIALYGDRPEALRAAAEEALDEITRLDALLSFYQPQSDISRLNARAAFGPIRPDPSVFELLQAAARLHRQSEGAFDITVGPLLRCWGILNREGRVPTPAELTAARENTGMQWVELDAERRTVRFLRPGVMLDLGAIGKGYALDRAAEVLRQAGVNSALIHGGTSSAVALGAPPGEEAWTIAIASACPLGAGGVRPLAAKVRLRDQALSVSAPAGQPLIGQEGTHGHVIDPRTGQPAPAARLAAVALPACTDADALSTALVVGGKPGMEVLQRSHPRGSFLVDQGPESACLPLGSVFEPLSRRP